MKLTTTAVATLSLAGFSLVQQASAQNSSARVHVQSGESIQKAIDAAEPGSHIIVEAGTYAEQLTITNDGTLLIGLGAILVPPTNTTNNTCSGLAGPDTEAGICITGADIQLADFVVEHRKVMSVGTPVRDVLVTGFEVHNFTGQNIAVVGGDGVLVTGNALHNGDSYGALTVGSNNTIIDGNTIESADMLRFIAICMDDKGDTWVANNQISGYYVGLCCQTDSAKVFGNNVTNSCVGVFVDPGVKGVHVFNNSVNQPSPNCTDESGTAGVVVGGGINSTIEFNEVMGMKTVNKTGAGIAIIDFPTGDTVAVPTDNRVIHNFAHDNDYDLALVTNGTGNVFQNNDCDTPAELCS